MGNEHMATPCKVAFVGAGAMAREHARAFAAVPGVVLAGIWNRTRKRAEALAADVTIPFVADSIAELHERTRADLVVIAVLEPAINGVARQCFEFPWTVLMEKPPGLNLADALDVREIASQRERTVLVALNRRFLSSTRAAVSSLEEVDGARFILVNDQEDLGAAAASGQPHVLLDNWMYANSIHLIDYFRVFGRGRITRVEPVIPWNPDSPQIVGAALEFDSGDRGFYNCVWNGPAPWSVSISSPVIRWELRPLEQAAFQLRGERRQNPVILDPVDSEFKPGFRLQAAAAVAAAVGGTVNAPTLDDAVETMELIARIYGHA